MIAREPALTGPRAILREIGAFGCALLAWDLPFNAPGEPFWPNGAFVCASTGGVTIASVEIKQNAKIVSRSIGFLRRLNITKSSLLHLRLKLLQSQAPSGVWVLLVTLAFCGPAKSRRASSKATTRELTSRSALQIFFKRPRFFCRRERDGRFYFPRFVLGSM